MEEDSCLLPTHGKLDLQKEANMRNECELQRAFPSLSLSFCPPAEGKVPARGLPIASEQGARRSAQGCLLRGNPNQKSSRTFQQPCHVRKQNKAAGGDSRMAKGRVLLFLRTEKDGVLQLD